MTTKFEDLTSDKARIAFVKDKLVNDERWMLRGMYAVYQRQTEDEKQIEDTRESNGVGFSGIDGGILTSFSNQMVKRNFVSRMNQQDISLRDFFSDKQAVYVRKYMPRYARQLVRIAAGKI